MLMGDRGDDKFVGAGGFLELTQLGGDRTRRSHELCFDTVRDKFAVLVSP